MEHTLVKVSVSRRAARKELNLMMEVIFHLKYSQSAVQRFYYFLPACYAFPHSLRNLNFKIK